MEKFEFTKKGYLAAQKWLKEIGEWENVSTKVFSTDGFSIVQSANYLWQRWQYRINEGVKVNVKSGDDSFIGVIEKVEWDVDQWAYLINRQWFCQSEVSAV